MVVTPTLEEETRKAQSAYTFLQHQVTRIKDGKTQDFLMDEQGTLWFWGWICVPKVEDLRKKILTEAHESSYSIHPGGTKMYEDLKQSFWWDGMKKDIAYFIARYDISNRVKAEHQKPIGLLQPLPVPQWKWDDVCMDFITSLPTTPRGNNAIWVVVDMLTKVAHFIPIQTTYRTNHLAQLYVSRIVSLHGVPRTITSDQGSLFTSAFWSPLLQVLGTSLK